MKSEIFLIINKKREKEKVEQQQMNEQIQRRVEEYGFKVCTLAGTRMARF